jgi:hypothetical protein
VGVRIILLVAALALVALGIGPAGVVASAGDAGGEAAQAAADLDGSSAEPDATPTALPDADGTAASGAGTSAPPLGADPEEVDLRAFEGEPWGDGYTAVPLRAAQPDWLTDEVIAELQASDSGVIDAPPEAPLPGWVGIRPGSWMVSPAGCTMNFVFEDGGDLAIGTAGHCFEHASGDDPVILLTLHPDSEALVLVELGPVLYETSDYDIGYDFALVDIPDHLRSWVDPTIAVVSGPCGTHDGTVPDSVWHYGHGLAIGTGGTPRAGVLTLWDEPEYAWAGAALFGDSGSAVRVTDLGAAGNLTHLVVGPDYLPAFIAGTTIHGILDLIPAWDLVETSACPIGGLDSDGNSDGDGDGSEDEGRTTGPPVDRGPDNDRGQDDGRGNGVSSDRGPADDRRQGPPSGESGGSESGSLFDLLLE